MRLLQSLGLVLLLASCADAKIGDSCNTDGDCASNLVCWDWPCVGDERCRQSCEQACMSNDECSDGRICSGMLCTRLGVPVDTGPRDSGSDASADSATDTGSDSATDTGSDSATDTGVDTGTDTGVDTGTDTSVDSGTDTGVDATVDSAT